MAYIGHAPTNSGNFYILDDFNGLGQDGGSSTYDQNANGTIVNFKLMVAGVEITPNVDNLIVTIDGVLQHPTDAYTISGSILTFDSGPAAGVDFHVIIMGQSSTVGEGSIGADELKISGDGTNNQLLKTDGDGTFSYINQNTVTASTAVTLATARAINGVNFDGSAAITVTAAAGTLSGNTLKSTVTASSLTSVGTLTSLTTSGVILGVDGSTSAPAFGFSSDTNTGIYRSGADTLAITSGGNRQVRFLDGDTYFDSRIYSHVGSAGNPSYAFNDDTNTGMYKEGSDSIGFAVAGVKLAAMNDNTLTVFGASGDNAQIRMYADTGTADNDKYQIVGEDGGGGLKFQTATSGSFANMLTLSPSGSATFAGDVAVSGGNLSIGEAVGSHNLRVIQSSNSNAGISIRSTQTNPTSNIQFTTNTGAVDWYIGKNLTEASGGSDFQIATGQNANVKLALNSSGNATFAGNLVITNGKGIDFTASSNNSGMTGELLDDYEEGTFNAKLYSQSKTRYYWNNDNTENYYQPTTQSCSYVKVGKIITVMGHMTFTGTYDHSYDNIGITHLPFNTVNRSGSQFNGIVVWSKDALVTTAAVRAGTMGSLGANTNHMACGTTGTTSTSNYTGNFSLYMSTCTNATVSFSITYETN